MDSSVSAALVTGLTGFSDDIAALIVTILPLAFVLLVTVAGLFFGIRLFFKISGMRRR